MSNVRTDVGYLRSIGFMRGFAAFGVLIYHSLNSATDDTNTETIDFLREITMTFICLGLPGMRIPLFFMISGFGNHLKYTKSISQGVVPQIRLRPFLAHRLQRLYPAYAIVVAASCLLLLLNVALGLPSTMVENYPGNKFLFMGLDFLAHLTFLHGFFSYFDRGAGNGPLWTMAREVQFHFLYFPLLFLRNKSGILSCVVASIVICLAARVIGTRFITDFPQLGYALTYSSLSFWPLWVFGMLSVEMIFGIQKGQRVLDTPFWLLLTGSLYASDLLGIRDFPFLNLLLLTATLFCLVMFLVGLELRGQWPECLGIRLFESSGKYSYHLYLVHFPIVIALGRVSRQLGSTTSTFIFVATIVVMALCSYLAAIRLESFTRSAFPLTGSKRVATN